MKNKIKYASIVFCLSVLVMLVSCGKQKTEWKGAIEEENGVTVIKNQKEPLYGEIKFELEEDLSIGTLSVEKVKGRENSGVLVVSSSMI